MITAWGIEDLTKIMESTAVYPFWRSLQEDARNCKQIYRDTLFEILQDNADTVFGRQNGFKDIKTVEQFRSQLPLTEYSAYADLVEDMITGAQPNAVTTHVPLYYSCTSGTTGKPSVIPFVRRASTPYELRSFLLKKCFEAAGGSKNVFIGNSLEINRYSSTGVGVGPMSAYMIAHLAQKAIAMNIPTVVPSEIQLINDCNDSNYLGLLFAMQSDLNVLRAVFITGAMGWLTLLRQKWDYLVRDIRNGFPGVDVLTDSPVMAQYLPAISAKLHPNPTRADELESLFPEGSKSMTGAWARRIWPSLKLIECLVGGTFSSYIPSLLEIVGEDVILFSPQHSGSEGYYGRNFWPGVHRSRYALLPRLMFVEFLPEEELDSANPHTVEVDELEQGKRYEIVITTFAGLCRYRLGDVIEVQGEFEGCPTYDFIYRRGSMLNILGEKTNEQQMADALKQLCGEFCWELRNFTTAVDWGKDLGLDKPRYVVYVELSEDSVFPDGDKQVVYRRLQHFLELSNQLYAYCITLGWIGLLQLHVVRSSGFEALKDLAVRAGASPNQFKTPRLLKSEAQLTVVDDNVLW